MILLLTALLLTGCTQGKLTRTGVPLEETVQTECYSGILHRTITTDEGECAVIQAGLRPLSGGIAITLTDETGDVRLELNEQATLPKDGMVTVTTPVGAHSYRLEASMAAFTGSFDIRWSLTKDTADGT